MPHIIEKLTSQRNCIQRWCPYRIYELIDRYFLKTCLTLDVGCGTGRDTIWLNHHGYPTLGIDGSSKMLKQAEIINPGPTYSLDVLPELKSCLDHTYVNILCCAVLMHLDAISLQKAVARLCNLLTDEGVLI